MKTFEGKELTVTPVVWLVVRDDVPAPIGQIVKDGSSLRAAAYIEGGKQYPLQGEWKEPEAAAWAIHMWQKDVERNTAEFRIKGMF